MTNCPSPSRRCLLPAAANMCTGQAITLSDRKQALSHSPHLLSRRSQLLSTRMCPGLMQWYTPKSLPQRTVPNHTNGHALLQIPHSGLIPFPNSPAMVIGKIGKKRHRTLVQDGNSNTPCQPSPGYMGSHHRPWVTVRVDDTHLQHRVHPATGRCRVSLNQSNQP
jgi:hypothetical protein